MNKHTNAGALDLAALQQANLALCVLSLTKESVNVSPTTTKAQLEAAEADFSGYAPIAVTEALDPILDPEGGASVIIPTQLFALNGAANPIVPNTVYNWWIETAGGEVVAMGSFDPPKQMQDAGDGFPLSISLNYGRDDVVDAHSDFLP